MSKRAIVGIGILMLGLLTGTWYALAAPTRGSAVEPGAAGLVANAVQVGSGGWVRYQVTVSNAGERDWSGDLRLVTRPALANTGGVQNVPGVQLPAPRPLGNSQVPSAVPDAALQVHVAIPGRHQRTIHLTGQERYASVELVGRNGHVFYSAPVDVSSAVPVAVLSDVDSAAAALTSIRLGDLPLRVLSFSRAPAFPSSLLQLGSFAAVVVDQFDLSALSQPQMAALRDYVGLGGSLVLVGGTSWRRTLLPVPPDLSPLRPNSTTSQSLQPVAILGGGESAPTAPVAVGEMARQSRVVVAGDSAPLMVELAYGAGRVVTLTFDPAADPVLGLRLAAVSWSQALGRAVLKTRASSGWASSAIPAPSVAVAGSLPPPPAAALPPPWSLALGLLAYMLLIGPLNLALSRRLGRPDLLWVTIPVLAVVSVGGLYVAGGILHRESYDQQLQVLRVGPQGTVSSVEYHEILFNQRGQHKIESSSNALLAPMTLGIHQATTADCPRCAQQLAGLPQDVAEHAVASSRPTVVESGVAYGNVRVVSVATTGHYALGLDAHLSVVQGRIQGRIKNLSDSPVSDLALYSFDGEVFRRTDLVTSMGPGEQVEIDAQPTAVDVTPPARAGGQSGAGNLADTIASAALASNSQPILLGRVQPLKSHLRLDGVAAPRGGSAVLVQPVRMESADTMLRSWQQVHLLGTVGDPRSGAQAVQSVYDIDVPAPPGLTLMLAFDNGQHAAASVEVYDWRRRAWRSGPWTVDPHNPVRRLGALSPDEVSGGTVRIRVKENRLTWGSYLQLESAASSS